MEILFYIILIVILIIIIKILSMFNDLIKYLNRVKRAQANIEICLNKRFDLIPNIVETVKGYAKHEKGTLEDIVSLRNSYNDQKNLNIKKAGEMNSELNRYLAIVENYPDLKANTQFMGLQNKLASIEDDLEDARRIYNDDVTRYNTLVETIPNNIVASMFGFKKADLFQIEDEKRENVQVKL